MFQLPFVCTLAFFLELAAIAGSELRRGCVAGERSLQVLQDRFRLRNTVQTNAAAHEVHTSSHESSALSAEQPIELAVLQMLCNRICTTRHEDNMREFLTVELASKRPMRSANAVFRKVSSLSVNLRAQSLSSCCACRTRTDRRRAQLHLVHPGMCFVLRLNCRNHGPRLRMQRPRSS